MRTVITVVLVLLFSIIFNAEASDLLTITSGKDNTIIQSSTGSLVNSTGDIFAGRTNQDGTATATTSIRRGLIYFDLSASNLTGASIDSVRLYLYFNKTSGAGTQVALHKVTTNWTEGTSYYNGGAGSTTLTDKDVTWLAASYNATTPSLSSLWTNPGGDFGTTISASSYVGTINEYGIVSWSSATMKAEVAAWIASPTTNFGWLLQGDESTGQTIKQFSSHETSTVANRPVLKVYYSKVSALQDINNENLRFSVYPNPATNKLTVRFAENNQERILIYNLCGSIVKTVEPTNALQTTIGLSDIKSGVYLIKVGAKTDRLIVK